MSSAAPHPEGRTSPGPGSPGDSRPGPSLDEAVRTCRLITRQRARNFYYGLKLSPEPQRSALYVVYAWMRRTDDLTDDGAAPPAAAAGGVRDWRARTEAALRGGEAGGDPVLLALADCARRFPLDPVHFHDMLDGQLDDLSRSAIDTAAQLETYCRRVASTVGRICISIWGYENARAERLAEERGIAFQLTNIIRDYRQDFDQGRVYLPRERFEAHALAPRELREWSHPPRCRRFMDEQIEVARAHYARSEGLEALLTPACRPSLWVMTEIYRRLLARMAARPEAVIGPRRVRLSSLEKGALALRATWRARALRAGAQAAGRAAASGAAGG
jgi:phytoene synthase